MKTRQQFIDFNIQSIKNSRDIIGLDESPLYLILEDALRVILKCKYYRNLRLVFTPLQDSRNAVYLDLQEITKNKIATANISFYRYFSYDEPSAELNCTLHYKGSNFLFLQVIHQENKFDLIIIKKEISNSLKISNFKKEEHFKKIQEYLI